MHRRARLISLLLALAFVAGEALAWAMIAPPRAPKPRSSTRAGPAEACCCCPAGACGAVCACSGQEREEAPIVGCAGDAQPAAPSFAPPSPSPKQLLISDALPGLDRGARLFASGVMTPDRPLLLPEPPPPRAL